jgi:hypothetical protein
MRPFAWLAAAFGIQAAGVCVLAALQYSAFDAPPSLGEASAVGIGYAVLIVASGATCVLGATAAFSAVSTLETWKAAAVVSLGAAPLVFVGVAELYATLAMLTVW